MKRATGSIRGLTRLVALAVVLLGSALLPATQQDQHRASAFSSAANATMRQGRAGDHGVQTIGLAQTAQVGGLAACQQASSVPKWTGTFRVSLRGSPTNSSRQTT